MRRAYLITTRRLSFRREARCLAGVPDLHAGCRHMAIEHGGEPLLLLRNPVLNYGPGTNIDITPYLALASNPRRWWRRLT